MSVAAPVWHLSPESQVKPSPDSHTSATSRKVNRNSLSFEKGIVHHEKLLPARPPSITGGFQEDASKSCAKKMPEVESEMNLAVTQTNQTVSAALATLPPISPISPFAMQMPLNKKTSYEKRHQFSSVENTDNFLAFLLQKKRQTNTNYKRYSAVGSVPQHSAAEPSFKQDGQSPGMGRNSPYDHTPFHTAIHSVTRSQNGLATATKNDIEVQNNIPTKGVEGSRDQGDFSVNRVEYRSFHSTPVAGNLDPQTPSAEDANASQDGGKPNNVTSKVSHGWEDTRLLSAEDIQRALLSEIMAYNPPNPDAPRLTEESLIKKGSQAPRARSEDSFCGRISDAGLETRKENVRATQGRPANDELRTVGNTEHHFRVAWECDRWAPDLSYMPEYIRMDWVPYVPRGPTVAVDTSTEGFRQGRLPVYDRVLGEEVIQPDCIPGEFVK